MLEDSNAMATSAGSAAVSENLEHADKTQSMSGEVHAATEAHGGPAEHGAEPSAFSMDATGWVSLAMAILIGVLIWKKVPAAIAGILDRQIAEIRAQLDEASKLRKEAEALKAEYEAKIASAAKDAEALRVRAQEDAAQAIEDAKAHAADLITRRQKMAEDKIAAAERAAIADIRAQTVRAATAAATNLISQKHDAKADAAMVDQAIKQLGSTH